MKNILIVGATGQLGNEIIRQLLSNSDVSISALIRDENNFIFSNNSKIKKCKGDLKDLKSLETACNKIDYVISTATVVFPKGKSSFYEDEVLGYQNLIKACQLNSVKKIIFISIDMPFEEKYISLSSTMESKLICENKIINNGKIDYTIIRGAPFMDDYFSLIGSEIPLARERAATLKRISGGMSILRKITSKSIENIGVAFVPGDSHKVNNFVSVRDIANILIKSIYDESTKNKIIRVMSIEGISWRDVANLYSENLNKKIYVVSINKNILMGLVKITKLFSKTISNQLSLLFILADYNPIIFGKDCQKFSEIHVPETPKEYLTRKYLDWKNI